MWNRKQATLGPLRPGQIAKATFTFDGNIELLPNPDGPGYDMETSCGCTSANWDPTSRTMTLSYHAKPIPYHLLNEGKYTTSQFVQFPCKINGHEVFDTLRFSAVVTAH